MQLEGKGILSRESFNIRLYYQKSMDTGVDTRHYLDTQHGSSLRSRTSVHGSMTCNIYDKESADMLTYSGVSMHRDVQA